MQASERQSRTHLALAATVAALGIALSAGEPQAPLAWTGWLTLLGAGGLLVALHHFGRLGQEAPLADDAAPVSDTGDEASAETHATPDEPAPSSPRAP